MEVSKELVVEKGEFNDIKGLGMRNVYLFVIVFNVNSSIICGCIVLIELLKFNVFIYRICVGVYLVKNKYFEKILEELGMNI